MDCALASPPGAAIKVARGRLAQLVERLLYTQDVGGSSPSPPTKPTPVASWLLLQPEPAAVRGPSRRPIRSDDRRREDDTVLPPSVVNLRRRALHRLFEFLGGAERDLLAGLDLDRFAGRRIAPHGYKTAACGLAGRHDGCRWRQYLHKSCVRRANQLLKRSGLPLIVHCAKPSQRPSLERIRSVTRAIS